MRRFGRALAGVLGLALAVFSALVVVDNMTSLRTAPFMFFPVVLLGWLAFHLIRNRRARIA